MTPLDYFATHPVFRFDDFAAVHRAAGTVRPASSLASLRQHLCAGHLLHVRRGLYVAVPRGKTGDSVPVDPYVLATHAAPDAVVAYHSALQFHGKAHSVASRVTFLTATKSTPFVFRATEFVPLPVPAALRHLRDMGGGILEKDRAGSAVRVTTLERTMVDVLDAPWRGGGWEEIWRSLESVEYFDVDAVIDYALRLHTATTVARVGFYLEQHRQELGVEEHHLDRLERHAPRNPTYMDRHHRSRARLAPRWALMVPEAVLNHSWEEILWT